MENYQQYCYPGSTYQVQMVSVNDAVRLRLISFKPAQLSLYYPILMIGGLATVIDNFQPLLYALTKDFEVHYLDTREKPTSQLPKNAAFDMETIGLDIVSVIKSLGFVHNKYLLLGYSFGATVIIDCYRHLIIKPNIIILLSPTATFKYPSWSLQLMRLFLNVKKGVLKPLAKWYIGNFYVNKKEDNEMYLISSRAIDNADTVKLKKVILAIAYYTVWDKLRFIDGNCLIVATSKDGLHVHKEINKMAGSIKNCNYLDLETNKRTHGAEMAAVIRHLFESIHS